MKTKNEIIQECCEYKKDNEEILDAFRKEYKSGNRYWCLKIKCLKHDHIFEIAKSDYKKGSGCKKCSVERRTLSKEQVVIEFEDNLKQNEKLIKVYQKQDSRGFNEWWATLYCDKHGEFDIRRDNHRMGDGCYFCRNKKISQSKILPLEHVKLEFQENLNKGEKLITVYRNNNEWYGLVNCSKHGDFNIRRTVILRGGGCPKCGIEKRSLSKELVEKEFKDNLNLNETLNKVYQEKDIKGHNIWWAELNCSKHGNFDIRRDNYRAGQGCPRCKASKGENKIREWLNNHNVCFKEQYKFTDCMNINLLPFDFYIPSLNLVIEYQGEQHYHSIDFFGGSKRLEDQQKRDNIKREYCKNNNIRLLEIPYTEYDNIEDILNKNYMWNRI